MHAIKNNTEALVFAREVIYKQVNADKTKYTTMYRDQYTGQHHNIKKGNKLFKRAEHFRYLKKK